MFGAVVMFLMCVFLWRSRIRLYGWRMIFAVLIFFSIGFFRSAQVEWHIDFFLNLVVFEQEMSSFPLEFSGVVHDDPVRISGFQKVKLEVSLHDIDGELLLMLPLYPEVWRGQVLTVRGDVTVKDLYGRREIAMLKPQVLNIHDGDGFFARIAFLRRFFVLRMQRLFPESVGGFLVGILAGGSRGLSPELVIDFRRTGLTHILAVSGSNVTILLQFLSVVFAFISRQYKFFVLGFCVLLFVVFVGFEPSAVRAGWMGFLGLLALSFGRVKHLSLMLLWSAFFMLILDPSLLLHDRGFQLSFLATIGVSYVTPLVVIGFVKLRISILEPMGGTIAVYILTFPIMASFGAFPAVGIFTNLIFVTIIPLAMLLGAGLFTLSVISFSLSYFFARIASVFLDLYFKAIHLFSSLPFAVWQTPPMSKYVAVCYYAMLLFFYNMFVKISDVKTSDESSTTHLRA